jgi:hypothetical protein
VLLGAVESDNGKIHVNEALKSADESGKGE